MVNITSPYKYTELKRTEINGKRLYTNPFGDPVPSVTTILSATKPKEDREGLARWKKRVGEKEAARVSSEASNVGNIMHEMLEAYTRNEEYTGTFNPQSRMMADKVIKSIEPNLNEVWGSEVNLVAPGLYAGTSDLIGMWKGKPAIMDFKQANKEKKEEWITDYFLQGTAYALAHNELYGTDIHDIAIFICVRDGQFQLFETKDRVEFDLWTELWNMRLAEFYNLQ